MRLDFGQAVYGSDGAHLGKVGGIIINSGTSEVTRILVDHGFGAAPRLVDISAVESMGAPDPVTLNLGEDAFNALPEYATREVAFPPRVPEFPTILPAGGVGGPVIADTSPTGPGYPGGDLFDLAPIDPPTVEVQSNLLDAESVLRHGSDVVASDGDKVGTLDEVAFGELGEVASIVVKAGFLFHHDLSIPVAEVAEFDDGMVHLKVTKEVAEGHRA